MALSYSTGFVQALMGTTGGMGTLLNGCVIEIYSGARPSSADLAPITSGGVVPVLLGTITKGGVAPVGDVAAYGLTFGLPIGRVIDKSPTEVWQFKAAIAGVASWLRLKKPADSSTVDSTTFYRIDASIGTSFTDAVLSSTAVAIDNVYTFNEFKLSWPG